MVGRRRDSKTSLATEVFTDACREFRVCVEARARGGAAERDLGDLRQRVADAPRAQAHLRGVAGELLSLIHI